MKQRLSSAPFRCLILGMACTAVSVSVRASNADTMHDISSEFASLRNARDEIQYAIKRKLMTGKPIVI